MTSETKKPRIVWHSNSPWSPTGYGNQTRVFMPILHEAGWEVFISSYYGLQGGSLQTPLGIVLPCAIDQWGNDILPDHYRELDPDVMFLFHDIWVLQNQVLDSFPASSWCPVDHDPIPPATADRLHHCRWPVAMSKFGERMMRKAGFDPLYIPLAADTTVYQPKDRVKARETFNIKPDTFFAVMVAANKGNPSRKSLDRTLKAWAQWCETHPNSVLYIHTDPRDVYGGYPLVNVWKSYGGKMENLRFPNLYMLVMGRYTWETMADIYNAADVLLSPSMGEGFGIPVVEAQACGCPVVVSDFSAQPELCFGGYKIPIDTFDGLAWTYQDSEMANVLPGQILKGIEWGFEQRGNEALRQEAVEGAKAYDAQRVFNVYMHPALKLMAEANKDEREKWQSKPTPEVTAERDAA